MRWKRWGVWLLGLQFLALSCGSSGDEAGPATGGTGSTPAECEVGREASCQLLPEGCSYGHQTCDAGEPNKLGECVCTEAALSPVGPDSKYNDGVYGLAFGADALYWTEYFFVIGEPYSKLVESSPLGSQAKVLVSQIPLKVDTLEVKDDGIHVDDRYVYSPDGTLLETLPGGAPPNTGDGGSGGAAPIVDGTGAESGGAPGSPPAGGRIADTKDGLLLDGQKITGRIAFFQEVENGVYYVEWDGAEWLKYLAFDQPVQPRTIADCGTGRVFLQFRVSDNNLGAIVLNEDRVTKTVLYGDLSVIAE